MVALNSPMSVEKSDLVPAQLQINRSCPVAPILQFTANLLFNLSYYKMKSFFAIAAFAGVALAQSAYIGLPTAGQSLQKGSDVVVQVQRPVSFNSAGLERSPTDINRTPLLGLPRWPLRSAFLLALQASVKTRTRLWEPFSIMANLTPSTTRLASLPTRTSR
jgi:hypothetical protein